MAAPNPHDLLDVERQALGAALHDAQACATLVAAVPPEWYTRAEHRALAATIWELFSAGTPVNLSTVTAAGVSATLAVDCTERVGSAANVAFFAALIAEARAAREAASTLRRAARQAERAEAGDGDAYELIAAAQAELSAIALGGQAEADVHIRHAVAEALERTRDWRDGAATDFSPSGFYSFDRSIGGLPTGELTTLAAMTGAGKTSLLVQAVRSVAAAELSAARSEATAQTRPRPVVVFSAEMSREQLAHRMAAGLSGVNIRKLRSGRGSDAEYASFETALAGLAGLEVHVDDAPSPSFTHIAARLTQVAATAPGGEIALVGVDYDEKVDSEGASEELRVSAIARGLKDAAKRFRTPVLALSQYGRKEGMHKRRPDNSWLRYSGKKEQESALVVHWVYPDYWVQKGHAPDQVFGYKPARPERGLLYVSKNRFGPTGDVALDFFPQTTSFRDPGEPDQPSRAAELADDGWTPPTAAGGHEAGGHEAGGHEPLPF